MTIPDANLLIYVHDSSSPFHRQARQWWLDMVRQGEPIGLTWVTVLAFLRLSTHARVQENPLTVAVAAEIVEEWMQLSNVFILEPGERHWSILSRLLLSTNVGRLTTDAHIAAIALEHRAVVATNDLEFQRFAGIRLLYPLA